MSWGKKSCSMLTALGSARWRVKCCAGCACGTRRRRPALRAKCRSAPGLRARRQSAFLVIGDELLFLSCIG